ncbi:MAG TPA: cysteine desulfurase [Dactylosporangium sp.]|nr:cysteine desulfurase [Dactylosporangium sp.]
MTTVISPATLPAAIRDDFPFFAPGAPGAALSYLDNAATTQKPRRMLEAMADYYTHANSNIGRGYYRLAMTSTDRFERARETVRRTVGARYADEIVFTAGTTHAVNLLAATLGATRGIGPGDKVLVTGLEHNSNLLPWKELCEGTGAELAVAKADASGRVTPEAFEAALDDRVRLAAVAHVSNVLGTVNPVRELAAAAHRRGVPVVVDGAQAVPHGRVDVCDLGADFYCFSGHKVYGPMGVGVLYGRRELLHELPPYQVGGGTVKGVRLDEPVRYVPGPARWEAGTPHVAGAVGLAAALDYLDDLGWDAVRDHGAALVRAAADAVAGLDRVRVVGDPVSRPSGIVSLVVDGIHPYDVGAHLDANAVAVRCGVHCASVFLDELGLLGTVRLSFGVYNTEDDVERVRAALATVRPGQWTAEHPTTRFL